MVGFHCREVNPALDATACLHSPCHKYQLSYTQIVACWLPHPVMSWLWKVSSILRSSARAPN